jgi:molybdopterin biosynthesis enzyme
MDGSPRAADSTNAAPASARPRRQISRPALSKISLAAGEAARIMTGAPLPEGADAVVPVEDTDFNNRDAGSAAPEQVQIDGSRRERPPRGMDVHQACRLRRTTLDRSRWESGMLGYAQVEVHQSRVWHCSQAMNCSWMLRWPCKSVTQFLHAGC